MSGKPTIIKVSVKSEKSARSQGCLPGCFAHSAGALRGLRDLRSCVRRVLSTLETPRPLRAAAESTEESPNMAKLRPCRPHAQLATTVGPNPRRIPSVTRPKRRSPLECGSESLLAAGPACMSSSASRFGESTATTAPSTQHISARTRRRTLVFRRCHPSKTAVLQNPRFLGPREHIALFGHCRSARYGLRLDAEYASPRPTGDSDPGRCGQQLGGVCQPGGGSHSNLGWNLLYFSSHGAPQSGTLAVHRPYRRDRFRGRTELLPEDRTPTLTPPAPYSLD